ncbi:MAG: polysaccharide biosynthesis protein [Dehalococcoidia bacterium]
MHALHLPRVEVGLVFTGLRPGEKLSEELHLDDEKFQRMPSRRGR